MKNYSLIELYDRCLKASYTTVENAGDFAIQREGNTLFLYLEWSDGATDWRNNFRFWAKPYKDMGISWRCHRGFLRVWKSIEPYVRDAIMAPEVQDIVIVGYSHGAAVATLAHEYVWFNRPDLRKGHLIGYGFGCPRCYWGFKIKKALKERWEHFYPVRNIDDIVTHVPPLCFGFRHVNKIITVGERKKYNGIDAHRPESYIAELK
jgi:hypothetical protein